MPRTGETGEFAVLAWSQAFSDGYWHSHSYDGPVTPGFVSSRRCNVRHSTRDCPPTVAGGTDPRGLFRFGLVGGGRYRAQVGDERREIRGHQLAGRIADHLGHGFGRNVPVRGRAAGEEIH